MIKTRKSIEVVKSSILKFSETYDFHLKEEDSNYILKKEYETFTLDGSEGFTIIVIFTVEIESSGESNVINVKIDFEDDFNSDFTRKLNTNYEKNSSEFLDDFEYILHCLVENNMPMSSKLELIKGNTFTIDTPTGQISIYLYVGIGIFIMILFALVFNK